jgi:hypothetical protein
MGILMIDLQEEIRSKMDFVVVACIAIKTNQFSNCKQLWEKLQKSFTRRF